MKLRIYLDNCCYNRPFDNMFYDRIRIEAQAVMAIIGMSERNEIHLLGSDVIDIEMSKMSNLNKKKKIKLLYNAISEKIAYSQDIKDLSRNIQESSAIKLYDSLHLASAIFGKADVFMTTDDKLEKAGQRLGLSNIKIINPVHWLLEVENND